MAVEVTILGQIKELGFNDWQLNKASDKYTDLVFKEFKESPIDRTKPMSPSAVDHIKVMCFEKNFKKDVDVKVPLNDKNIELLKKVGFGDSIDFADCVVGHYIGSYNNVLPTIKANQIIFNTAKQPQQPNK